MQFILRGALFDAMRRYGVMVLWCYGATVLQCYNVAMVFAVNGIPLWEHRDAQRPRGGEGDVAQLYASKSLSF